MPPDPSPDLFDEAHQLIDDIQAGRGLASLSAGSALAAIDEMIKRLHAFQDADLGYSMITRYLPGEHVLDALTTLRDKIAASGLPPHPFQSTDFRVNTTPAQGASGEPTGGPAEPPTVPPQPAVTPPVAPGTSPPTGQPTTGAPTPTPPPVPAPTFLPDAEAQRWLSDQRLPHDSPAYRVARDYWMSLVKDFATVAGDAAPALSQAGVRGDIAEGVQYRAEAIKKAVETAFPEPAKAVVPAVPPTPRGTGAPAPPTPGVSKVKPLPAPPERAPRRGLTFGRLTMLLVLLLLLLAGGVIFVAGHAPAPAGSPAPSATAPTLTSAPTGTLPAESVPASVAEVITDNELVDNVGSPCTAPTTLHMKWVFQAVAPGTTIVVDMSGPGLPAQATFVVGGDDSVVKDYTVPAGAAIWTTDLAEIGGAPAPSANARNTSTVTCSGP